MQLIAALDAIEVTEQANAAYLQFFCRPDEPFQPEKFNSSGLSVVNVHQPDPDTQRPGVAVLKASNSENALEKLRKKIEQYSVEDGKPNKVGETRPKNADLVNSISSIEVAELRDLWRHPRKQFPVAAGSIPWEVWLEPSEANRFVEQAIANGVTVYEDRLEFPEDTVVLIETSAASLAQTTYETGSVRAVSPPGVPIDFVDGLEAEEQADWVQDVLGRTQYGECPTFCV